MEIKKEDVVKTKDGNIYVIDNIEKVIIPLKAKLKIEVVE